MDGMIYVGIDPGLGGAVGVIYPDGTTEAWHTPTVKVVKQKSTATKKEKTKTEYVIPSMVAVLEQFTAKDNVVMCLEQVSSRKDDGKVSAFTFGRGVGLWEGILAALRLDQRLYKVLPTVWRPRMVGVGATKSQSRQVCRKLFPDLSLPLAKDEAKAEAILIAYYVKLRAGGTKLPKIVLPSTSKVYKSDKKGRRRI